MVLSGIKRLFSKKHPQGCKCPECAPRKPKKKKAVKKKKKR